MSMTIILQVQRIASFRECEKCANLGLNNYAALILKATRMIGMIWFGPNLSLRREQGKGVGVERLKLEGYVYGEKQRFVFVTYSEKKSLRARGGERMTVASSPSACLWPQNLQKVHFNQLCPDHEQIVSKGNRVSFFSCIQFSTI